MDGLDERSFVALLGETDASLQRRTPVTPPWLPRLQRAFAAPSASHLQRLPVVGPLVAQASARLTATAQELSRASPSVPFSPESVVDQIMSAMIARIDERLSRSVVLEMRVAALEGRLTGDDGSERLQNFLERLRGPGEALSFLREYPVLARILVSSIEDWTAAGIEILERLCVDWDLIQATFWPTRDPGPLASLDMGLGDSHRGGREVCLLRFGDGDRLVYKPRSLRMDSCFASWLRWLEERGAPELRAPRVLDRGAYGWSEFVAHSPCRSREEACRFYERQGALLALLYALNASDFHRENLVASGEHPVLIDLETLCGPDFGQAQEASYDSRAEFDMKNSVITTMLLPVLLEGKGRRSIDPSGLGGRGGQTSIDPVPEWEHLGTDALRLSFRRREIGATPNQPELDGAPLNALHFAPEIEAGFTSMYRLLEDHRGELLSDTSPLSAMGDAEVRVMFRATRLYSLLLAQSHHPDYLRDALDRDRLFDRLWFGIDRTELSHVALRLLPSERQDLWRGDIPCFTTRVSSHDLWTSQGTCLHRFLDRSGWDMVRHRLARLGEEDLHEQLQYIRGSLSMLALNHETVFQSYPKPSEVRPAGLDRVLAQAVAVAERIVKLARWSQDRASWIGLAYGESNGWHLRPLTTDLYSGLPGIALFLAYTGAWTGRGEFTSVARGALATLRKQMQRRRAGLEFVGGFDGWGGLLYVWIHLFHLWQDDELLAEAESMVSHLAALAGSDEHLDIVQGSTGAIVPLLTLHELTGAAQPLDLARRLGDRLLTLARPCDGGIGWAGMMFPNQPLTGFSHGASGFAWALTELFAASGERAYARAALQAAAFERRHLSLAANNWADLRQASQGKEPSYMTAWCHGACGIGISRLRMQRHLKDAELEEDLQLALETTYLQGFGKNHSLCHGDMGSLELLLQASLYLPGGRWGAQLSERLSQSLASMEEHGWRCGVPLDVETPGLMDGLAGVGHELLRLTAPDRVPSVLILEGPKREGSSFMRSSHA